MYSCSYTPTIHTRKYSYSAIAHPNTLSSGLNTDSQTRACAVGTVTAWPGPETAIQFHELIFSFLHLKTLGAVEMLRDRPVETCQVSHIPV